MFNQFWFKFNQVNCSNNYYYQYFKTFRINPNVTTKNRHTLLISIILLENLYKFRKLLFLLKLMILNKKSILFSNPPIYIYT